MVYGDFNEILFFFEKRGGAVWDERCMKDFRLVLSYCSLKDLRFVGPWFIWEWG